jgi:hypothetical protein
MSRFIHRVTYLTYTLLFASITLLSLSIATLVLQSKVVHVFRDLQIQIPGSNLVEWAFVSLSPTNLDTGPTVSILVTAACGVLSSIAMIGWIAGIWGAFCSKSTTRVFGLTTCVMLIIDTSASLALTVYINITQASQTLPERFRLWSTVDFTHEFYICTAFPSLIPNAEEEVYGFPACEAAKSARLLLIGVTIVSCLLAGLAGWQAQKMGVVRMLMHPGVDLDHDDEKAPMRTTTPMSRAATPTPRMVSPTRVHIPEIVRGPRETRQAIDQLPLMAPVPVPDLEDYYYEDEGGEEGTSYPRDRKEFVRQSVYGFYTPL